MISRNNNCPPYPTFLQNTQNIPYPLSFFDFCNLNLSCNPVSLPLVNNSLHYPFPLLFPNFFPTNFLLNPFYTPLANNHFSHQYTSSFPQRKQPAAYTTHSLHTQAKTQLVYDQFRPEKSCLDKTEIKTTTQSTEELDCLSQKNKNPDYYKNLDIKFTEESIESGTLKEAPETPILSSSKVDPADFGLL